MRMRLLSGCQLVRLVVHHKPCRFLLLTVAFWLLVKRPFAIAIAQVVCNGWIPMHYMKRPCPDDVSSWLFFISEPYPRYVPAVSLAGLTVTCRMARLCRPTCSGIASRSPRRRAGLSTPARSCQRIKGGEVHALRLLAAQLMIDCLDLAA